VPIGKPWLDCRDLDLSRLPGTVGVYELGDSSGRVIYIGYAGGRSRFGLRGALAEHCGSDETNAVIREHVTDIRFEVTTAYLTRHLELLSQYQADFGVLPEANMADRAALPPLARLKRS
jgi:excinuclease UvrABC nuclease subunit